MTPENNPECVEGMGAQCLCAQLREDFAEMCLWTADAIEGRILQGGLTQRQINAGRMLQLDLAARAQEAKSIPLRVAWLN